MTDLLTKAFEQASKLPTGMQDEIAKQILEDIDGEMKWDETLAKSQKKLSELASKALKEYKSGRTKKMGFDEI